MFAFELFYFSQTKSHWEPSNKKMEKTEPNKTEFLWFEQGLPHHPFYPPSGETVFKASVPGLVAPPLGSLSL